MKTALSTCLGNVSFSQGISIDFFSNKLKYSSSNQFKYKYPQQNSARTTDSIKQHREYKSRSINIT